MASSVHNNHSFIISYHHFCHIHRHIQHTHTTHFDNVRTELLSVDVFYRKYICSTAVLTLRMNVPAWTGTTYYRQQECVLLDICWNVDVLFSSVNCHTYILWMTLHDNCAPGWWHCCCTLVNTSVELYLHSTRQSIISMVCRKVLLRSIKLCSELANTRLGIP